jgi:peptidoglycan hydrolase-like protein with peptidoglycan-binding domain
MKIIMKKLSLVLAIAFFIVPSISLASINSNLQYGARGQAVTELQNFLISKGFLSTQATGNFYSLTQKAVITYQQSVGLPNTGFVGPMTRTKINAELSVANAPSTANETAEIGTVAPPIQNNSQTFLQQRMQTYLNQLAQLNVQMSQINSTHAQQNTNTQNSQINTPSTQTQPTVCIPNWQTGSWGVCINGQQTRAVTDPNNCGTTNNEPILTQACYVAPPTPQPTSITPDILTSPLSGNITKNSEMTLSNSPYIVTGTVQVLKDVTLKIEPGVVIKFNKNTGLVIDGELYAVGESSNTITFTTSEINPDISYKVPGNWYWGGISFTKNAVSANFDSNNNYLSGSIIKYSTIEYAEIGLQDSSGLSISIDSNTIKYNNWGMALYGSSVVTNNNIDDNDTYGIKSYFSTSVISQNNFTNNAVAGSGVPDFDTWDFSAIMMSGGSPSITKNNIENNARGLSFWFGANPNIQYNNIYNNESRNIKLAQSGNIQAPNNYWGVSDVSAISSTIDDYYDNAGLGKVIYNPISTSEIPNTGVR